MSARLGRRCAGSSIRRRAEQIEWDQKHLPDLVRHAALLEDPDRRRQLDRVLARFVERALPAMPALRAQVIHNDITLDNLLLDAAGSVSGIIDFGDMTHTALVLDVPGHAAVPGPRPGGHLRAWPPTSSRLHRGAAPGAPGGRAPGRPAGGADRRRRS